MTRHLRTIGAALILLSVSPVGCAPLGALAAIDDAAAELRAAEEAGAMAAAPYDVWAARAFIDNARLAEGLADHRGAVSMARIARAHAQAAHARVAPAPPAPVER